MKPARTVAEVAALPDEALITDDEVAQLLNVATATVKRWDRDGPANWPKAIVYGPRVKRRPLGAVREFMRAGFGAAERARPSLELARAALARKRATL